MIFCATAEAKTEKKSVHTKKLVAKTKKENAKNIIAPENKTQSTAEKQATKITTKFTNPNITIKGNERIDDDIINSYLSSELKNNNFSKAAIDKSLKNLIESDLFLDAKILNENHKIIVEVKENPIISEVKFVGNKKIDDDALQAEASLKKRGIFTKYKLQSDLKRINEIYLKSGRFLTHIEPKIITKDENRVEVIFDINEGPKAKIAELRLIGNNNFSDDDLLNELTTKKSKWYKFLSSSDVYDSDRIEFDKEKLRRFYASHGYADFTAISSNAEILPTKDKFFITFLIEEGIKYNIGEINIINHIAKFDEKLLDKAILFKTGKVYNADLIEKTVDKMVQIMSDNSYAFAHIEPVLKRNKEQKIIDIDFVIDETPRVYIDRIVITGNTRTMDEVIRREVRLQEGDAYNITKLNRSRQRIQNLAFFENVDFKTKRIGNSDKVDIEIIVKEKKTGELNFGVGYSTVDKATANIGLKERNLMGTGQELGVNLQRSKYSLSSELNYTRPYFAKRAIDVGFDLFKYNASKRNTLVYDQSSEGFTVRGDYAITEFLNHQIRYTHRSESITDVDPAASLSIKNLEGSFTSSIFGQSFVYDKRDNKIDPREGYYLSVSQDYSGPGGDIRTMKYTGSAGYYLPTFSNDYVLKLLFRGGVIDGLGQDVRGNFSFFLGGNNFRGFEYAGLGPRTMTNGSAVGGNAVGGNVYYVTSAEFRFPLGLPKELGINGILFTDIGTLKSVDNINKRFSDVADSGSLRQSYGLSIAWSSPMGPIRFDFSKVAKKEEYDRTQNFRFNFGTNF